MAHPASVKTMQSSMIWNHNRLISLRFHVLESVSQVSLGRLPVVLSGWTESNCPQTLICSSGIFSPSPLTAAWTPSLTELQQKCKSTRHVQGDQASHLKQLGQAPAPHILTMGKKSLEDGWIWSASSFIYWISQFTSSWGKQLPGWGSLQIHLSHNGFFCWYSSPVNHPCNLCQFLTRSGYRSSKNMFIIWSNLFKY